ncbi:MAG: hypothetical protein CMJ76_07600 [Planctomycetaceae bacterium]|nr:hypothetical protein [Planctomycetaceae bacterium]|tara:strand:- start:3 stop:1289 length:1287 start_codon:yes stop_codon:yes gene_type:complete
MSTRFKTDAMSWLILSSLFCSMTACTAPGPISSGTLSQTNTSLPSQPSMVTIGDSGQHMVQQAGHVAQRQPSSDQSLQQIQHQQQLNAGTLTQNGPASLPPQAYTGPNGGLPYPVQWTPPGITGPFPEDEYVYQGGDGYQLTNVAQDFSIDNLDEEDTIAHYHTLNGDIEIERTNRLPIYAPRFASTRRIDGLIQYRHQDHVYAVDSPLALDDTVKNIGQQQVKQQVSSQRNIATRASALYKENQKLRDMAHQLASTEDSQMVKPQVGNLLNTKVNIQNSQEAELSIQRQTALAQTDEETVKEFAYDLMPYRMLANNKIQTNYHYEIAEGNSRLDIKKVASKQDALPGELLEFTITFKNTGDEVIGNVTIVDHLSRRLAYVEESQNCTVESEFFLNPTGKESVILRWEVVEPMQVGETAAITFKCRVR